jgi:NAD(P)-dependent dehydrogenase (short-subunit alcohol dehydrogenase family)
MKIKGSVVFITGANRGLGLSFAKLAVEHGAAKVYGGMRNTDDFKVPGIIPIKIDVTDDLSVKAAAIQCSDTTLLINNAGIASITNGVLDPNMTELSQHIFNTNYYGIIRTVQAFSPLLASNGGGGIINVLSDSTWVSIPMLAAYAASKSAAWSLTNSLRIQLRPAKTQVLALHVGFLDTDLTKDFDVPKTSPTAVVKEVFAALESGEEEIIADEGTRFIKSMLSASDAIYLNP